MTALPLFARADDRVPAPLVLSYGMGVDSTGVLVGWRQRTIRPDLIMFADTGSEHRATYRYRAVIEAWLHRIGFPPLTVVRYRPRHGRYTTLVEDCLIKGVLPSLAYGSKACSQKWKVGPQDAYLRTWRPALAAWSHGQRLDHAIGYDAGPKDMRRGGDGADTALERFVYPLRDWGWGPGTMRGGGSRPTPTCAPWRHATACRPVPPKSACVCCPSTRPCEVDAMAEHEPAGLGAALAVEAAALPTLRRFDGLWRRKYRRPPWLLARLRRRAAPGCRSGTGGRRLHRLQPCLDPDLTRPPPKGTRYAVRSCEDEIVYLPMFRDALQEAGAGAAARLDQWSLVHLGDDGRTRTNGVRRWEMGKGEWGVSSTPMPSRPLVF